MSPALAGRFSTTAPPGKPLTACSCWGKGERKARQELILERLSQGRGMISSGKVLLLVEPPSHSFELGVISLFFIFICLFLP